MDEMFAALIGLDGVIIIGLIYNSVRVGRLQGRMENGDYLRCPFYRRKDNNAQGGKSNQKTSCRR